MDTLLRQDSVTKRRLLQCGAAGLAFAPMLAAAQNPPPPADAQKIATVNDAAKRLTVTVSINGQGPYNFVIDTGADRTVFADDIAATLGLPHGGQVMVQGVVRTLPSQTVLVRDLSFGPVTKQYLHIPVLPRALLQADGYLGLDALDEHRVTFDFKNHLLEVGEKLSGGFGHYLHRDDAQSVIPVSGDFGHLRSADCNIAGVPAAAFIDTGAAVSVGNPELFAALQGSNSGMAQSGTIPLTGVTGGTIDGHLALVDTIKLKDLNFSDCTLVIADLQIFDIWGLAKKPALMIGMNYLRQFAKVSIDYGSKELRFDLARLDDSMIAMQG